MYAHKIQLKLGAERPLNLAHLTDIHLCLADERDAHLIKHADDRNQLFHREAGCPDLYPEDCFAAAMEYSEANCDLAVITGDVLDFVTEANMEASDRILKGKRYMFTAGNHEFCPQVGIPDSQARKFDIYGKIQSHFQGNMFFESRVIHGINLVTIDNSYYNYSALQIEALKKEIAKGYPIVIFSHVPLTDAMINLQAAHKDLPPDGYMKSINTQMLDLIASCPLIKAEFAGHWHVRLENSFRGVLPEYVTAGCFKKEFTHIEIL